MPPFYPRKISQVSQISDRIELKPSPSKGPSMNDIEDNQSERNVNPCQIKGADTGVKKIEAVALIWSRNELKLAYLCVFVVFFVLSLQQQIHFNVISYVTSSFLLLPLTGTTSIAANTIGGTLRLATGKFIDIVGRPEGFILMTAFTTIGIVMMAATTNVETFTAAQVFYWVGFDGMGYVMNVFMADTSSPKNRPLVFAFSTTPYIFTTFMGPRAAASYLKTSGWPWAYATFAIAIPIIVLPLLFVLYRNERKARKSGLIPKVVFNRSFRERISHYFFEFDVIGLVLLCAAFILILLPFSLASYQSRGWTSTTILAMLTTGIACALGFAVWEKFFAPVSFIPFKLLQDPSIWGACMLANFLFISFYMWDNNLLPFLQAVYGLSVTDAGYISNIISIGSCLWAVVFAGILRIIGRFKYLALWHLSLELLGVGLMIHFRQPKTHIGFVIMCQIFIALANGGLLISEEMAVIAACPHETVAIPLALLGLFSSLGAAIGTSIASAILTNKFPAALEKALPGNATLNALLYGDLEKQLAYPFGTPERDAIQYAYGETMWYQTWLGVAFLLPCFLFIGVWKNFKIKEMHTIAGNLL